MAEIGKPAVKPLIGALRNNDADSHGVARLWEKSAIRMRSNHLSVHY